MSMNYIEVNTTNTGESIALKIVVPHGELFASSQGDMCWAVTMPSPLAQSAASDVDGAAWLP